ncbi:MAG: xanthine dehydrogenase FAD-binding subunit XdhB [Spirochaetaceae bacterium]|jgi:xanthine dehydrogenase FAD-binding subunit|nr:xanthine dehydrogenase FAD-binding subunit XdhB [Spirochaetaceae bacterium]
MYDITALYEAETVPQAIALLQEHPRAYIIAGGSDMLIRIRKGGLPNCELVSLRGILNLRGVSLEADETLRIGPLTVFSHLVRDPLIRRHIPPLAEAAEFVGGPQIRNVGTIGGNICNGASSADTAPTLLAWDAILEYTGPAGIRQIPIENHYLAPGKTALARDEILTAILIPKQNREGYHGCSLKYARRNAMDLAILGCSVNVRLEAGILRDVRAAYGVAGPVPLRARTAENVIRGKPLSEGASLGKAVRNAINPRTSWRGTQEFRLHLAEELTNRALAQAIRAAGSSVCDA